jgi:hypothetical protein
MPDRLNGAELRLHLFPRSGGQGGARWARVGAAVHLCVPKTSSTSCDQAIFVDQPTDASLSSDAALTGIDRLG